MLRFRQGEWLALAPNWRSKSARASLGAAIGGEATQQTCGAETPQEAAQEPGHPPGDHHDGQAGVVPGGGPGSGSNSPSPTWRNARKQPRRKLPPGHPTTRAKAAEVQVARLSPEVPLQPRPDLQHLQSSAPPDPQTDAPPVPGASSWRLGGRDDRGLNENGEGAFATAST
jgi:hypothetical protein